MVDGLHGGVPDWLLKEQQQQQQQQQQRPAPPQQGNLAAPSVPRGRLAPDVRRSYYTTTRQQQREYQQQQGGSATATNHNLRTRLPNHRIPPSEPIYLDIDPSIHQPMTVDHTGHRSPLPGAPATLDNGPKSPSRLRSLNCNIGRPPTPPANHKANYSDGNHHNGRTSNSNSNTNYPFVRSYESPVAKEYRVQGGMFQNNPPQSGHNNTNINSTHKNSLYDTTPVADQDNVNESFDNMIMFGDDYDLGSITTGMSQQELLQKRRDVKKRRDGKYGKKKKNKERTIIQLPPSLLSSKSWDTSPITKFVGNNNNNRSSHAQHTSSKDTGNRSPKHGQWNILRSLMPTQDEQGDTDATTLESGEHSPNPASPEQEGPRAPTPSDNHSIGSNSFPLLSSTARNEFIEGSHHETLPHHYYSHSGTSYQQQTHPQHRQMPQSLSQADYYRQRQQQQQQQQRPAQPRPQHMDIYQRQHGEELQQLEHHLKYLQEQHLQLEQEIQERQRMQQDGNTNSSSEGRPRAVRFASQLAQDMEEQGPSDEEQEGNTKISPTSVTQSVDTQEQEETSNTSVLEPKVLFAQPKSILRRKNNVGLDSNGRYNGFHRGRMAVTPRFYDTNGREVSPIRSPARPTNTQQEQRSTPLYPIDPPQSSEDLNSIPENPDDKDIAVLFDSETDIDIELMRREFDEDSGVMSEAFIEAVAAIVLQTAIRRFLAIRRVLKLKGHYDSQQAEYRQNLSPSPTQTDGSLSQRAVASEQKSELESQTQSRATSTRTVAPGEQMEGQSMDQEDFFYDLAAIQIQCVFRGWWVRDSMNVDHYCTTLIQRAFRGFRARMEYEYDLYRITMVQALWRRKTALRGSRGLLYLVVKVQAICRGFLVRQSMNRLGGFPTENNISSYDKSPCAREHSEETRKPPSESARKQAFDKARMERRRQLQQEKRRAKAAETQRPSSAEESSIAQICSIIIQTYWRSYFARVCFLQSIADVTLMQSVVRGWLARRRLERKMQTSPAQNGPTISEGKKMVNKRMEKPPQPHAVSSRMGERFKKFESFESRNALSVGPDESTGSSNKKTTNSIDESVPSVPFKMLPEDDPDQPPSLTPPRGAKREQTSKGSPSHFNNPNRFGGPKASWNASEASGQYAVASNSSYESANIETRNTMPASQWTGRRNTVGNNNGTNPYEQRSKWDGVPGGDRHCDPGDAAAVDYQGGGNNQDKRLTKNMGSGSLSQPSTATKEKISRSKGWNVEEEIEKEATRNLIMAWKQKDKANTFTIKPHGGD